MTILDTPLIEARIQARQRQLRIKHSRAKDEPTTESEPPSPSAIVTEHFLTPKIQSILKTRSNLYLVGPAGSGKSYAVEQAALTLNLPFYCPPIGRETTNAQLFGYFNAAGEYVRTPIRQAVEFGGVLHFEEIDFASPAVGTALNALLANKTIGFPDAAIPRHPDFICVASANTFGNGANAQYIGSQGLNAATRNRFVYLDFPYDERLERSISKNIHWTLHVIETRAKAAKLGLKHVISPRQSIQGGLLLETGEFTWLEVEAMTIFAGLDEITIEKLRAPFPLI